MGVQAHFAFIYRATDVGLWPSLGTNCQAQSAWSHNSFKFVFVVVMHKVVVTEL